MALDFPASPSNGQTYTGPGGVVWTWDGSKWVTQGIATAYLPLAGGTLTGVIGLIPGSVTAPAVNFGTANTGIYGNANLVGITSGGQARFTVDNNGAASQGPLTLPGAPTADLHAATKLYVDGFLPLTGNKTVTGNIILAPPSGSAVFVLSKPASGQNAFFIGRTGSSDRWDVVLGDTAAETGSNAGSNFGINRHADNGAYIDTPLTINRATGDVVVPTRISARVLHYDGNPATTLPSTALNASLACSVITAPNVAANAYFDIQSGGQWRYLTAGAATNIVQGGNIEFYINGAGSAGAAFTQALRVRIWSSGDLEITGSTASKPGGGPWVAPSGEAIKENIAPYNTGLAALLGLQPVTYTYKPETGFDPDTEHVGLVFEQVPLIETQRSAPLPDGTEVPALDPGPLTYALINAVKELAARVTQLEGAPAP